MVAAIIVAALGSGGLAAVVTRWQDRRKTKADTDRVVVDSAVEVVAMLRSEVAAQRAQLESQGRRITDVEERLSREQRETARLRRWITLLLDQIRGLGVEPVAEPSE